MYCACPTSLVFHFWSVVSFYSVSAGDGKGFIFLSFDSSFMRCEQFCQRRTFYFDDVYLTGKP